jgi:hypothetical protein
VPLAPAGHIVLAAARERGSVSRLAIHHRRRVPERGVGDGVCYIDRCRVLRSIHEIRGLVRWGCRVHLEPGPSVWIRVGSCAFGLVGIEVRGSVRFLDLLARRGVGVGQLARS